MNEDLKLILKELLETKSICNALIVHLADQLGKQEGAKLLRRREKILDKYRSAYPEVFR